jgi:site-specific DNA-cytosine methylase
VNAKERAGGGKGFLLSNNKAFTLATSNFHTVFLFEDDRRTGPRLHIEIAPTLQSFMGTGGGNVPMIMRKTSVIAPTLSATNNPSRSPQSSEVTAQIDAMVRAASVVRRLTPTECERLQGFPDGWTDGQADSHRYKQMGNAVAVPVVQWIINRIVS